MFSSKSILHLIFLCTLFANQSYPITRSELLNKIEKMVPAYENWLKDIQSKLIIDSPSLRFWLSDFNDPFANIVMHSAFENTSDLEEAIIKLKAIALKNNKSISWNTFAHIEPAQTAELLIQHGFINAVSYEIMELALDTIPLDTRHTFPKDVEIRILDSNDALEWMKIVQDAFEYNHLLAEKCLDYVKCDIANAHSKQEHFAGYYKGALVATGTLLICSDGWSHVYDIATTPEAQHKGIAKAMMRHIIKRAQERNCTLINLMATADGKALYEMLGFKKIFDMPAFIFDPSK